MSHANRVRHCIEIRVLGNPDDCCIGRSGSAGEIDDRSDIGRRWGRSNKITSSLNPTITRQAHNSCPLQTVFRHFFSSDDVMPMNTLKGDENTLPPCVAFASRTQLKLTDGLDKNGIGALADVVAGWAD